MKKKNVTALYAFITAGYWMGCVIYFHFAGDFLSHLGYLPSAYGLIIAVGSLLSAVLAPFLGSVCDKHPSITPLKINLPLYGVQLIALILMLIAYDKGVSPITTFAFILYITACVPVNSINLKMCMDFQSKDFGLNFSVARGFGSFGFMVFCIILGWLLKSLPYWIVPICGILLIAYDLPFHMYAEKLLRSSGEANAPVQAGKSEAAVSLPRFFRDNGRFTLMLIGLTFIFIAHNLDANFVHEINDSLHGNSETLGWIGSFTAIVEVPILVCFIPLFGRMKESTLLRFSFIAFVFKILAYALAPTIGWFIAARLLQAPSYAVFTAAIVPYVQKMIPARDAAKAQSLAFTVTTIGSVISSMFGGFLYESMGSSNTLLVATAAALLGAVLAILGTQSTPGCVRDTAASKI